MQINARITCDWNGLDSADKGHLSEWCQIQNFLSMFKRKKREFDENFFGKEIAPYLALFGCGNCKIGSGDYEIGRLFTRCSHFLYKFGSISH